MSTTEAQAQYDVTPGLCATLARALASRTITRRRAPRSEGAGDRGFTLVELLVVIIIIGILAAIAIPVFLNQRAKAYDASVKSDLRNFAVQLETTLAGGQEYPDTQAEVLALDGLTFSKGNRFTFIVEPDAPNPGYVLIGRHTSGSRYYVLSSYDGGTPQYVGTTYPTVALGDYGTPTTNINFSPAFTVGP